MSISIIGHSGFLGSYFKNYYKKRNIPTLNLSLRSKNINFVLNQLKNQKIIFNCASSLNPKTKNDFYLNESIPKIIENFILKNKLKVKFVHFSSLNTIHGSRVDQYTISKLNGDNKLSSTTIIVRLPLIIEKKNSRILNKGNIKKITNVLNSKFLPICPAIFPGHTYYPLCITKLIPFLEKHVLIKKPLQSKFNLMGKKKMTLFDIVNDVARTNKKKILKIPINLNKIKFLRKRLLMQNNFFQQLCPIDYGLIIKKNKVHFL